MFDSRSALMGFFAGVALAMCAVYFVPQAGYGDLIRTIMGPGVGTTVSIPPIPCGTCGGNRLVQQAASFNGDFSDMGYSCTLTANSEVRVKAVTLQYVVAQIMYQASRSSEGNDCAAGERVVFSQYHWVSILDQIAAAQREDVLADEVHRLDVVQP